MAKIPGAKTKLSAEISGTMTLISQRVNVAGPTQTVNTLEVTDLDSTRREYRPLLPDSGTLTCQVWFDPNDTVHQQLQAWMNVPELQTWELSWACTPVVTAEFEGFLTNFTIGGMDVDGYLTADLEIQISGDVTFTTA